jgi:hypothetical protein
LVGKPDRGGRLGRSADIQGDNIKIDFKEIKWVVLD